MYLLTAAYLTKVIENRDTKSLWQRELGHSAFICPNEWFAIAESILTHSNDLTMIVIGHYFARITSKRTNILHPVLWRPHETTGGPTYDAIPNNLI